MSPTSYQAAPPRGRGANLIEAASPRQEESVEPRPDSKPTRAAAEDPPRDGRGGDDACGLHQRWMLRIEILGPSNELRPTLPGDRVDLLDGGLDGRRVRQTAGLDFVDGLGLQRRILVILHGTSLERNPNRRCKTGAAT